MFIMAKYCRVSPVLIKVNFSMILKTLNMQSVF